ncbi:MAG TPA: HAD family phosphatase, partial [Candidatus Omnitrophota bacterium]|nr:HAD family phosphatase [Candidatus Omnitrophota bacterium]
CWRKIFIENGIQATRLDIYLREGQKGIDSVFEIFKKHKKEITILKAKKILKEKELRFNQAVKTRFIPGIKSFIKKLHSQNIRLALVTGTSRKELFKILPKEMLSLFAVTITGSDVQKGKPHPEPYLKCLKQLRIKPHQAIVIENAPLGILSAKKAGMTCLALETSLSKKHLKQADKIFKSVEELSKSNFFLKIL